MMGQKFTRIVEECLHRLDRGENLPDVLADFPAQAEQLKPLLLVAMASRAISVPVPNQTARRMGRNQMLAEMDQIGSAGNYAGQPLTSRLQGWIETLINAVRARGLVRQAPSYRFAVFALVMLFGVGLITISASASGLPGGVLGSFTADIRQALTFFNPQAIAEDQDLPGLSFLRGGDLLLGGDRAAKVAFLLDMIGEEANSQVVGSFQAPGARQESQDGEDQAAAVPGDEEPADSPAEDDGSNLPADLPDTAAADYAPGTQDDPATAYAPGLQDGPATDYAPGLVKKIDPDDGEESEEIDEEDEEKDKKDKDK